MHIEDWFPATDLLSMHADQLQRLWLYIESRVEIREGIFRGHARRNLRFQKLTELQLVIDKDWLLGGNSFDTVFDWFSGAPELLRLQLGFKESLRTPTIDMATLISDVGRRFPKLNYFQEPAHPSRVREGAGTGSVGFRLECLTFLEVRDSPHFTYDFLLMLPKLRVLNLGYSLSDPVDQVVVVLDHSPSPFNPKVSIREQIQTGQLYKSNVWEHLKELEEIGIETVGEAKTCSRFDRANYNKMKLVGKTEFKPEEPDPLREDIWENLELFASLGIHSIWWKWE